MAALPDDVLDSIRRAARRELARDILAAWPGCGCHGAKIRGRELMDEGYCARCGGRADASTALAIVKREAGR